MAEKRYPPRLRQRVLVVLRQTPGETAVDGREAAYLAGICTGERPNFAWLLLGCIEIDFLIIEY